MNHSDWPRPDLPYYAVRPLGAAQSGSKMMHAETLARPPAMRARSSFGVGSRERAQSRVCVWGGGHVQMQTPRGWFLQLYFRSVPTCRLRARPGGGGDYAGFYAVCRKGG